MTTVGNRPTLRSLLIFVALCALGPGLAPVRYPILSLGPPVAAVLARYAPGVTLAFALTFLLFAALGEVLVCFPIPIWFYTSIGIASMGFFWPGRPVNRRPPRVIAFGALLALLGTLYLVPWSSRKPFLRALDSIKLGMTEAEVHQRMAGYKLGTGWIIPGQNPAEFAPADSLVFRHSDDPEFNSDWGIVTLQRGKVTAVQFSPD